MRYLTLEKRFYAAWDTMVLLYTQYPTITPVAEEQIEHDLIAYLDIYGSVIDDDYIVINSDFMVVDPQSIARLILQDIKEALQHD